VYVSVVPPAALFNSVVAFALNGTAFGPPSPTFGVTGGIDVDTVAFGAGDSTKRFGVEVNARVGILGFCRKLDWVIHNKIAMHT
jgi:hypothetical protein